MLKYLVKRPQKRQKLSDSDALSLERSDSTPEAEVSGLTATGSSQFDGRQDEAVSAIYTEPLVKSQSELDLALPAPPDDLDSYQEVPGESGLVFRDQESGPRERIRRRGWTRGKSSLYVDAFNLALDDVLKSESYLFDKPELAVFEHWRGLSYDAQYL